MKHAVDEELLGEIARFDLRFTCEDCVHFDAAEAVCAHGYPTEPHRRNSRALSIVFCKEYELA